jgi:rubrerythrin
MIKTALTRISLAACTALIAALLPAPVAAAERLNDKDVKQLIDRIDNERDRFEDQLDGKLKRSIIRGAGQEVNVEKYQPVRLTARGDPVTACRDQRGSSNTMIKTALTRISLAACTALIAALLPAPVAAAERLNDKDVKQLIDRIDNERDRFEDQLDGKLKRSIIRGAGQEVNVEKYLDDLQENVDKLKGRLTPQYAASAEVTAILRQGTDIQRFMATQPANLDGSSEWNRLAASLGDLATAYATTFPIADGQQARRMNDAEVRKVAGDLAKSADHFKKELDASLKTDATVDKAAREAAVKDAETLKKDAEKLASTVGDGRPASGEAQALLQLAAKLKAASSGRALSAAAKSAWSSIEEGLDKVGQAVQSGGTAPMSVRVWVVLFAILVAPRLAATPGQPQPKGPAASRTGDGRSWGSPGGDGEAVDGGLRRHGDAPPHPHSHAVQPDALLRRQGVPRGLVTTQASSSRPTSTRS